MRIKELVLERRLSELDTIRNYVVFGNRDEMVCVYARGFSRCDECGVLDDAVSAWYLPRCFVDSVSPGDLLAVETTTGNGVRLVVAVSTPFVLTRAEVEENGHPYCAVIKNLGEVTLASGKTTYEVELF